MRGKLSWSTPACHLPKRESHQKKAELKRRTIKLAAWCVSLETRTPLCLKSTLSSHELIHSLLYLARFALVHSQL